MFGFKRRRVIQQLLAQIVPCVRSIQDEIGNVPPATHNDAFIIATLYGVIYSYLLAWDMDTEDNRRVVSDRIFEEIFRREAIAILTYGDKLMKNKDSEFYTVFQSAYSADDTQKVLDEFTSYINRNYEKQPYRDL